MGTRSFAELFFNRTLGGIRQVADSKVNRAYAAKEVAGAGDRKGKRE